MNSVVSGNTAENGGGLVHQGGGDATLTLNNSTVEGNTAAGGLDGGGGIFNDTGTLSLNSSRVRNNLANEGDGGGIFNDFITTPVVLVTNSVVSGNTANGGNGGGIFNGGGLVVSRSTVADNTVYRNDGGGIHNGYRAILLDSTISNNRVTSNIGSLGGGSGGGISNAGNLLTLIGSTVSGNFADGSGVLNAKGGGGISNGVSFTNDGTLTLINSTVSGNSTRTSGGGIFNYYKSTGVSDQRTTLINSTITGNIADADNNGSGNGGGLYSREFNQLYAANSLIAGNVDTPNNTGPGDIQPDVSGPINGNRNNLIGNAAGQDGTIGTGSDVINANPRLGPLADNGGLTPTHALRPGSPAIDAGSNNFIATDSLDLDQDGNTTEQFLGDQTGRQRIAGRSVDIGAVERGASLVPFSYRQLTGTDNLLNDIRTTSSPVPAFADLDSDGDLDAAVGNINGGLLYLRNDTIGFTRVAPARNPFANIDVGFVSTPIFVDLDGDRDQDLAIGAFDGTIRFYQNNNGRFVEQIGTANPFNSIDVGSYSNIAFANVDGDSNMDAFLGLANGRVAYYQNNNGRFTFTPGTGNPLNGIDAGDFSFPSFGDLDGDGDEDAMVGEVFGGLRYYRNDGGRFIPATGTNNPLNGVDVGFYAAPSFADLDGDGDEDAVIGGDTSLQGNNRGRLGVWQNSRPLGLANLNASLSSDALIENKAALLASEFGDLLVDEPSSFGLESVSSQPVVSGETELGGTGQQLVAIDRADVTAST